MTWLAPWFLAGGVLAALAVVGAHLLARHRPPRATLPTARFVPASKPVSSTRLSPPSDRALLALRALACLLVAAAFARPVLAPRGGSLARVVVLDRSHAVGDHAAAAAAARAELRAGDLLVLFDSAAGAPLEGAAAQGALASLPSTPVAGSLSAGLAAAMRAGAALRTRADSVELVVVSPFAAAEHDAATMRLRDAWPGRVRLVDVAPRSDSLPPATVLLRAAADDPLRATIVLAGLEGDEATANRRLVRARASAGDSAWVRAGTGRVLVEWPADSASAAEWRRERADSMGGVVARGAAVVAPFARTRRPPAGRAVARWADGEPMATETPLGEGCVRRVALDLPASGDLVLRPAMQRLLRALTGPCALPGEDAIALPSRGNEHASIERAGAAASSRALARLVGRDGGDSPLAPWLLAFGALLLVVELFVRDRARQVPA